MADSIPLIGPGIPAGKEAPDDRMGGEQHGFIPRIFTGVTKNVPAEQFGVQMEQVIGKVREVSARLKSEVGEYNVEEIKIGLAVSTEGTIGVATAGVEASIEVTLKRK
jgi:hypothetical protein